MKVLVGLASWLLVFPLHAAPGDLDPLNLTIAPANSVVYATAVQPDGKVVLGGYFSSVLGVPRQNIARLNADGSLDLGFDPRTDDVVRCVAVQPDGKIVLGGNFSSLQPNGAASYTARSRIARLHADGSLDADFDPKANEYVLCLALQRDGKIVLGGRFTTLQPNGAASPTARNYVARIEADGSLDAVFDPNANWLVYAVAVQADGRVLLGGGFTTLQPNGAASPTGPGRLVRVMTDGTRDPGFNHNLALGYVVCVGLQEDSQVLFADSENQSTHLTRLDSTGARDTTFNPNLNGQVLSFAVQKDGKILLGGLFTGIQTIPRQYVARIREDGTLDASFNPKANAPVYSLAQQADGKVLLGGSFTTLQPNGAATPAARGFFARLENDPATQTLIVPYTSRVAWLWNGAAPLIFRGSYELSTDGGASWSFVGEAQPPTWTLIGLSLPTSGKLRARGVTSCGYGGGSSGLVEAVLDYTAENEMPEIVVRKFDNLFNPHVPDGGSASFGTAIVGQPGVSQTWRIQNDGPANLTGLGITITGPDAAMFTVTTSPTAPLATNGATTFTVRFTPTSLGPKNAALQIASNDPDENPYDIALTGTGRESQPGDLDLPVAGTDRRVLTSAIQPDGKIIIGGVFNSVLGVTRRYLARLNADGTLDMGFDPSADFWVTRIVVQPDGKVLIGGLFRELRPNGAASPTSRWFVARLHADGSLDTAFDPHPDNSVGEMVVQPDGKILLGGGFTTLQPTGTPAPINRRGIARLHTDGTLDLAFDLKANGATSALALQPDGKILLGGAFTTLQPTGALAPINRQRLARVDVDGTLDLGFDPSANGGVACLAVQANGKVVIGGDFTALQPNGATSSTPRRRLARVNADGTLDAGFDPGADGGVESLALQTDGKVLASGVFQSLQPNGAAAPTPRGRIARVHADGSLDTAFDPKANDYVNNVNLQADGKILLGGWFTTLQPNGAITPTPRSSFARLINDPATQTLTAPDEGNALWQRGGSRPELSRATFELSTDGGTIWNPLGEGARIGVTPNWQTTGLALPTRGLLRARGTAIASLIELLASFDRDFDQDGLRDAWELAHWPTLAGHSALDDFDRDGVVDLLELAFGLSPLAPEAALPQALNEGGYLTITIAKRPGALYEVQTAGTLLPGEPDSFSPASTTLLLDTATTLKVRDNFPSETPPARFLRVKVIAAP